VGAAASAFEAGNAFHSGKLDPYRLTAVQAFNLLVEVVGQSRDLLCT